MWNTGEITSSIVGKTSGAYSVVVTDNQACTENHTVDINDTNGPNIQISYLSDVTCNGDADGKATIYLSGLSPTNLDIIWTGGSTTTVQDNLSGGFQTVRVTDLTTNCVSSISVYIDEPEELMVSASAPSVCDAGEFGFIDLNVTGGVQNYRYIWSNGSTSQDLIDINSGSYTVTVTDVNACQKIETINLTVPALSLSSSISATNVNCKGNADGQVNLTVQGGTAPYSYLWNYGQTTEDVSNVLTGFYEVTVTDAINCKSISSVNITEPTSITKNTVKTDVTCFGLNNGNLDLTVAGGTPPYTFDWTNSITTEDYPNLSAGTYTVTITDDNFDMQTLLHQFSYNYATNTIIGNHFRNKFKM